MEITVDKQTASLRKMKAIAAGLVLLMAVLLFILHDLPNPWVPAVLAFVEAALVGALADWFAVTALFRHPLGIPFPHSAILATNKERIGANLGIFVRDNFLDRKVIQNKLSGIDLSRTAADWLSVKENRTVILARVSRTLPIVFESVADQAMYKLLEKGFRAELRKLEISPFVGKMLSLLIEQNQHQRLIDELLNIASEILDKNRNSLRQKVEAESPWFLPTFIDTKIYQKIINNIETSLAEIGRDPHHPMRRQISTAFSEFVVKLKSSEQYRDVGEVIKNELLNNQEISSTLQKVLVSAKGRFLAELGMPNSAVHSYLDQALQRIGVLLVEDAELRNGINSWMVKAITRLADTYRESASNFIAETVNSWETQTMVDKFELEIGRDLQFIRINGTIVGGLVGLTIYLIKQL